MILQYRRVIWDDKLYNSWWLWRILVLWWPVDEAEYDGDARDGN